MTEHDLRTLCQDVQARPLLAPMFDPSMAEAVLRLYAERDRWRYVQYRRVDLAWVQCVGSWWARTTDGAQMWYAMTPGAVGDYWVYGSFPTLAAGQAFCQWHNHALAEGTHLEGAVG